MRQERAPIVQRAIHVFVAQHAETRFLSRRLLRNADAVRALSVRNEIEDRHAHHDAEAGRRAANRVHDLRDEPHPILERAAVLAGACRGTEHLVPEIPVARLRVNELISALLRQLRRGRVIVDDAIDFRVCQHTHAAGESCVENRVMTRRERRRLVPDVWAREASRVRNLQAKIEIAVGVGSKALAMRREQLVAQACD